MENRYSRQIAFGPIGEEGQKKLNESRVAVIGLGALGSVSSNELARSGIGFLRIVDKDSVDLSNLQRQVLYTEEDVAKQTPKVEAAAERLRSFNSDIIIDPVSAFVDAGNIDDIIADVDLVVDATDNMEVRTVINEACRHHHIPWIYGGVAGSYGMAMNFLGGDKDPCFSCLFGADESLVINGETAMTTGILNMLTNIISSIECVEAVKILTGSKDVRKDLLYIDIWTNEIELISVEKDADCPVCVHHDYVLYKTPENPDK